MQKPAEMPAVIEPLTGYIALGVVVLLAFLVYRLVRAYAGRKKEHKTPHAPASAHKPAHGSHDHPEKASGLKRVGQVLVSTLLMLWYVAIVVLVVYVIHWLHEDSKKLVQANSTYSVGQAAAAQARAARGGHSAVTNACPVVSDDWQRTILPPGDADWPSWTSVPRCHRIKLCDPVNDPGCSAKDFSDVRFDAQCRSLSDGQPRNQESGDCTWTDAYRMRAKGSEPMPLLYRFERAS